MKKILLIAVLAICCVFVSNTSNAQTALTTNRPLVWGTSPFQDSLWSIDTTTWTVVNRLGPTLAGFTITGMNGLATDPTTGITYVIMKVSAVTGRVLGTIDLTTGVCTQVGNLGDNFSSINFREDGQLFGMTGDGATTPETLYLIDKTTAAKTVAAALGAGADGEVICYNRANNLFYHWSGNGTVVFESVLSVAPYTATNIPTSGTANGETFGALYLNPTNMLRTTISSNFTRQNINGAYAASQGSLPDDLRGPVMIPYFQFSDDSVCEGSPYSVTGGGHQLLDNFIYHWGDGTFDTVNIINGVLTVGSHSYSAAGTMTVEVSTWNGFGGDTIWSTTVVVNPLPVVSIFGFAAICSGDSTTLFSNSTPGTQQWYLNGAMISGATNANLTVGAGGVYNVLTTSASGCSDSAATGTNVLVGNYPVIALGPDTAACSWYVLDAGNPGSTYMWSNGPTTQLDTITVTSGIVLDVISPEGCSSTSAPVVITINTPPTVNIGPDTTVCGSYTADAGNPGSSYLWCDGSTTQTVNLTSSGTCPVMVTDTNGCVGSDTISVIINPNPVVTLGPDVSACTMVVITADSSLIGGTFLWCTGGTGLNEVITNTSTCDLQYTDVNGCMGYDTINITIYGNPTVTASAVPTSVCADDADVTLTGSPAGGSFTGTSVAGNSFDPSVGAGNYSIVYNYTDVNGCSGSDTVAVAVSACVGIEETNASGFTMYPNPTTGVLNFTLTENSTVEVFDVLGNTVAAKQFTTGNAQIDLSNQLNGVYFVRVNGTNAQRLVIQK